MIAITIQRLSVRRLIVLAVFAAAAMAARSGYAGESPETVLVTFRAKQGKADELAQLIWRSWATYQRLNLVLREPHIMARSHDDNGGVTFSELFSWKSHGVPESAPSEVRNLWNQMEADCEARRGGSGIDFVEVDLLHSGESKAAAPNQP